MENEYTFIEGWTESRIAGELRMKYLNRKIEKFINEKAIYVLATVLVWVLVTGIEVWKLGQLSSNLVYHLN